MPYNKTPSISGHVKKYGRVYLVQQANHNEAKLMGNQTRTWNKVGNIEMAKTHLSSGLTSWSKVPERLSKYI